MSIYEYDEERHIRQEREVAWEEGRQEGERIGLEKGRRRIVKNHAESEKDRGGNCPADRRTGGDDP